MKKYKKFVHGDAWRAVRLTFIVIVWLVLCIVAIDDLEKPCSADELMTHIEQVEQVRDDFSNIANLNDATVVFEKEQSQLTFEGAYGSLIVYFDANGQYVSSQIIDNITFGVYVVLIIVLFTMAAFASLILQLLLYIPICLHMFTRFIKSKRNAKRKNIPNS